MNVINLLIWSKDRACQLHSFLESILKNAENVFDINVLYTTSNSSFNDGYSLLKKRFSTIVSFHEEQSFRNDTLRLINREENTALSTDDGIIFSKLPEAIPTVRYCSVFSLRLGLNTILQNYHDGSVQPPLNRYASVSNNIIGWDSVEYHPNHNYGYPFSLDMHIYNTQQLMDLVERIDFKNTNELEGRLTQFRAQIPYIYAFRKSVYVNIPVNNMSHYTLAGKEHSFSLESLNAAYLDNHVIDLDSVDGTKVIGAHQEFPLRLVKYG